MHILCAIGFGAIAIVGFGVGAWELWRHCDEIAAALRGER